MQILVISDTHGHYDMLKKAIDLHADADLAVHCGDGQFETDRWLTEHPEREGWLIRVRGNCDYDRTLPLRQTLELPFGHKAVILHGHTLMYGDYQQNLVNLAKDEGADLVLFGHLHVRMDRNVEGIRLFNPGSAALPRDQFPPGYGLADIMESGLLTSHGNLLRSSMDDMQLW